MSLTIELTGLLEERVRRAAEAGGVSPRAIAEDGLRARFGVERLLPLMEWSDESLLQRLNQGLPDETWRVYRQLMARLENETLPDTEHARLIELSDQVEAWNVLRLEILSEMARRKGTSLRELMRSMGLLRQMEG